MCIPAIVYLVYVIIYILMDIKNNNYSNMVLKIWIGVLIFALLHFLCYNGLTIIAWLMIAIPFIYMILVISILLFIFNVDPSTGTVIYQSGDTSYSGPPPVDSSGNDSSGNTTSTQTVSTPSITVMPTTFQIGS